MGRPVDRTTFPILSLSRPHHEMGLRPAKLKSLLRCAINAGLPCPAARTVARAGQWWWRDWRRPHERPADRLASIDACGEARQPQTSGSVGRRRRRGARRRAETTGDGEGSLQSGGPERRRETLKSSRSISRAPGPDRPRHVKDRQALR